MTSAVGTTTPFRKMKIEDGDPMDVPVYTECFRGILREKPRRILLKFGIEELSVGNTIYSMLRDV